MLRLDAEFHAPAPSYRTVHMQPLHRLARIRSFSSRAFRHPQLILAMKDQPYGVGVGVDVDRNRARIDLHVGEIVSTHEIRERFPRENTAYDVIIRSLGNPKRKV